MNYILLTNNVVTDLVRVNPLSIFPKGYAAQFVQAPDGVEVGWTLVDGEYQAPPVPPPAIPSSVSPRQIRQALTRAGLRTSVEAAVAAGDQDLKDWWEFSTQVERINPQVTAMGAALGVTEQQLDELWALADSL